MMNIYDLTIAQESSQFIGTMQWYRHFLGILYTDGVRWLSEKLNCHWLIDEIALHSKAFWHCEPFMSVEWTSPSRGTGRLRITDGNGKPLTTVSYDVTDLFVDSKPLIHTRLKPCIQYFLVDSSGSSNRFVLLLPSEY